MSWHFYFIPIIFITSGIFHLIKPKIFTRIMPLYLPYHKEIVYVSGIIEILVGIGLFIPPLRFLSLWIVIILLILFLPVHIHMLQNKKAGLNFPKPMLVFRLFLQFGFIYWAYQYI